MGNVQAQARAAAAKAQQDKNDQAARDQADQAAGRGRFASAFNPSATAQNPTGGGQGKVGGPYGVIITNPSAVGGLRNSNKNQDKSDWNSKEKDYAASLKNNAGILPPSTIAQAQDPNNPYNKAISDYERGNQLTRDNKAESESILLAWMGNGRTPDKDKSASIIFTPGKYNENYGYTNTKPTSSVAKNTSIDPLIVNFEPDKGRVATQARSDFRSTFSSDQGGVVTPQSKGKSYGTSYTDKTSQTIGATIFSNQKSLVRNSPFEKSTQQSEAERASSVFTSKEKAGYSTGGGGGEQPVLTLGKAQGFFGNKTKFGWNDVSKDQLVRGSNEEKLSTTGLFAGRERYIDMSGKTIDLGLITDKGSSVFVAAKNGQYTTSPNIKSEPVQSVKPTPTNNNVLSDRDFRSLLTNEENQGAVFSIFSGGKKVGETSGVRSYHDYLAAQKTYGNNVVISASYPEQEKSIIQNVKSNPDYYARQPSTFWQNLGERGYISSKGMSQINIILRQNWFEKTAPIRAQDKAFRQSLTEATNAGLGFDIKDKNGTVVGTTKGPRSYHDYLAAQKAYGKDVVIEPRYEWTFGEFYNKITAPPPKMEQGSSSDIVSGFVAGGKSLGGSIYSLGLSTYQYAQKPDKSLDLGFGAKIPYSEQARKNVVGFVTGGIDVGKLGEGKIAYDQNIKLTPEGQKISDQYKSPSFINTQLGIEKPSTTSNYLAGGALLTSVIAGAAVYGAKGIIPLKTTPFPLPYEVGVKPARSLTLGSGGEHDILLIGRGNGKFFTGMPKEEHLNLSKLAPTTSREGFESGTGTPIQNKVITEVAVPALQKSGKLSKTGTLDIIETGKEGSKLATSAPTIQFRGFGEKPFRSLTREQTPILLDFVRSKKFDITGSTAEIPFTKEGLVSQARDLDIKGVPLKTAQKNTKELAIKLQEKALPNQIFKSQGTSVISTVKEGGKVREEKILEFPQREVQEGYGLSEEEKSFVFGIRVPKEKTKVEGIKTVTYDFQGLRKIASSTEFHIGDTGDITVRASSGREVKDPAHVYSFLKTKSSNYLITGKQSEGERLNIIAENYRSRHPELNFENEYRSVNEPSTLELTQHPSVLSNIGSSISKSSSILSSNTPSLSLASLNISSINRSRFSSTSKNKKYPSSSSFTNKSSKSPSPTTSNSKSLSSTTSKSSRGIGSSLLSSRGGNSSKSKSPSSKSSGLLFSPSPTSRGSLRSASPSSPSNSIFSSVSPTPSRTPSPMMSRSPLISPSTSPPTPSVSFTTNNPKLPIIHGNLGIRRKYKMKEGPTGLLNLNVNNIFSSSLSITVKKGQRYEF